MGDMADYYMDLAMQYDAEFEAESKLRQERVEQIEKDYMIGILKWKTKSGSKIMVSKMTVEHLENSIEFIKRAHHDDEISQKWIEILGYELEKRNL